MYLNLCPANIGVIIPENNNNKPILKLALHSMINNNQDPTFSILSLQNNNLDLYTAVELYTIPGAISEYCDIWSFGILSFFFITHKTPFKSKEDIYNSLNNKLYSVPKINSYRYDINYILELCLSLIPNDRPKSNEVYKTLDEAEIILQKQSIMIYII